MANEKRLIDANALKEQIANEIHTYWTNGTGGYCLAEDVIPDIDNAPTVDAVEVVHGKWTAVAYTKHCNCDKASNSFTEYLYKCSACNRVAYKQPYGLNYCPNCGAKMDGGN